MHTLVAGLHLPQACHLSPCPKPSARSSLWRLQHRCHRHPRLRGALLTLPSAVKEERKTTGGRKGEGRTTSSRTSQSGGPSKTASGRKDSPSPRSPPPPSPQRPQQPPAPRQQRNQPSQTQKKPSSSSASRLDAYMRKHPFFSRFYDTTLLLGDCVMILATEASSERIDWGSFPTLVGVLLGCWVAAGAWNGDYSPSGSRAHEAVPWQLSMLGPTFGSIMGAALTWSFASPVAAGLYAALVANGALDAAPVVEGINSDDLSPQLEVIVALLITMTCWRGIASKLRPTLGE